VATAGDAADTGAAADVATAGETADAAGAADADNVQQGDQSTPDTAAEAAGSEQVGNDGPSGHADEVTGTAGATTQGVTAN
jgi:hypothetical protein